MVVFAAFLLVTVSSPVLGCFTSTNSVSFADGTPTSCSGFKKKKVTLISFFNDDSVVVLETESECDVFNLSQTELELRSLKNQTVAEQLAVVFKVLPVSLVSHGNR